MEINFNIAFINQCTKTEGIGKRLAIWFQGCNINCIGCCNQKLQEFKPANIISLSKLIEIIQHAKDVFEIEGVTYLGGEPTLQQGLAELSQEIHKRNLGIILFTGKRYESLSDVLINSVDIIIDGKFEINNLEKERNLVGSTNQKIIYVTERYKGSDDWFTNKRNKQIELNIADNLFITGDVIM